MTHLEIKRDAYGWQLLLDGKDIKDRCLGFTLETNEHKPNDPPILTLRYMPDRIDIETDEAEVVEVPHEHDWLEITTVEQRASDERHYVCDGCPAKRTVREVIEAGESA